VMTLEEPEPVLCSPASIDQAQYGLTVHCQSRREMLEVGPAMQPLETWRFPFLKEVTPQAALRGCMFPRRRHISAIIPFILSWGKWSRQTDNVKYLV
jgi:hypothetical protein